MTLRLLLIAAPLVQLAAGCHSPAGQPEPLHCTLVFLRSGPRQDLPAEERREVFAGHFANMERLAKEGHLLLAGPFDPDRHEPALRGIFVLDTADRTAAEQLAASDPGCRAGVFAASCHDLVTTAPLRQVLARDLERLETAAREGRTLPPGDGGRTYALLLADDGARAEAELVDHPVVVLAGRLDDTRFFALLDAKDAAAARTALGDVASRLGAHTIDDWFGSGNVAELPRLPRS